MSHPAKRRVCKLIGRTRSVMAPMLDRSGTFSRLAANVLAAGNLMRKLGGALVPVVLLLLVSASGDARPPAAWRIAAVSYVPRSVKAVADFPRGQWLSDSARWRLADPLDYRRSAVQRTVPTCAGDDGGRDCGIQTSF
jgi:hypothetical protein